MGDKDEVIRLDTEPRPNDRTLADYLAFLPCLPRSIISGALKAHAPATIDRLLGEGPRITNYNFDSRFYNGARSATIGGYLLTAGYLFAEHGFKGLAVLGIPLVSNIVSGIYEMQKE